MMGGWTRGGRTIRSNESFHESVEFEGVRLLCPLIDCAYAARDAFPFSFCCLFFVTLYSLLSLLCSLLTLFFFPATRALTA